VRIRVLSPLILILTLALLLGMTGPAAAQKSADDERARELYDNGAILYEEGRYEDAIAAWKAAYDLSPKPLLLFNVANAYERIGGLLDAPEKLKSTLRETQSVVVAFDEPVDASLIESCLSVKTEKSGDKWRVYTDNPDMLVKKLTRFAEGQGLSFTLLEICGPSLEDVFVKLTEKGQG